MSVYGNDNLAFARQFQTLTVDGTSDTVTLPKNVTAVTLYCPDELIYVNIGAPGSTPVAAAPSAEKTETDGFPLFASTYVDVPVPVGSDNALVKIAAKQSSAGGTLYVIYREFV